MIQSIAHSSKYLCGFSPAYRGVFSMRCGDAKIKQRRKNRYRFRAIIWYQSWLRFYFFTGQMFALWSLWWSTERWFCCQHFLVVYFRCFSICFKTPNYNLKKWTFSWQYCDVLKNLPVWDPSFYSADKDDIHSMNIWEWTNKWRNNNSSSDGIKFIINKI